MKERSCDSKFLRIRCPKCKNEQIVFGKASSKVLCLVCDEVLGVPSGGKTKLNGRVLEVLN